MTPLELEKLPEKVINYNYKLHYSKKIIKLLINLINKVIELLIIKKITTNYSN